MDGNGLSVLIIGGSGFVSGTLARTARDAGYDVWVVTRGRRPVPDGVTALKADRKDDEAFAAAIEDANMRWDLAVDCIAYDREDTQQDLDLLPGRVDQLVFISTDFVFDPARRSFPQPSENPHFLRGGYGGRKRQAERRLINGDTGEMQWTVLRPCHIYGPGSDLGCMPEHARDPELLERLRDGEPLRLVGGGHFLQQPVFVHDLAELILSAQGNEVINGQAYNVGGPDIVEARRCYEIIADILGVPLAVEELPIARSRDEQPEWEPFLCHRIYDLTPLRLAGLKVPNTPIAEGLHIHVESLL